MEFNLAYGIYFDKSRYQNGYKDHFEGENNYFEYEDNLIFVYRDKNNEKHLFEGILVIDSDKKQLLAYIGNNQFFRSGMTFLLYTYFEDDNIIDFSAMTREEQEDWSRNQCIKYYSLTLDSLITKVAEFDNDKAETAKKIQRMRDYISKNKEKDNEYAELIRKLESCKKEYE